MRPFIWTMVVLPLVVAVLAPPLEGRSSTWQRVVTLEFHPDGHSVLAGLLNGRSVNPWYPDPKFLLQDLCQTVVVIPVDDPLSATVVSQRSFPGQTTAAVLGHFGRFASFDSDCAIVTGHWDGAITRTDPETLQEESIYSDSEMLRISSFGLSPDGRSIAVSHRGNIVLFSTDDTDEPVSLEFSVFCSPTSFSPDGQLLATGSYDGVVIWNTATNQPTLIDIGHDPEVDGRIYSLQFSPDGETLAIGREKSVVLWDTSSSSVRAMFDEDWVSDIAFHPNGSIFATAGKDAVRFWNSDDGEPQPLLVRPGGVPRTVEFSPNGNQIAVGDGEGDVTMWNSASGQNLWRHHIDGVVPFYIANKFRAAMFAVSAIFLCIGGAIHFRTEKRPPETDSELAESG